MRMKILVLLVLRSRISNNKSNTNSVEALGIALVVVAVVVVEVVVGSVAGFHAAVVTKTFAVVVIVELGAVVVVEDEDVGHQPQQPRQSLPPRGHTFPVFTPMTGPGVVPKQPLQCKFCHQTIQSKQNFGEHMFYCKASPYVTYGHKGMLSFLKF